MAESEIHKLPDRGNYHRAKRDLLRRAVQAGRVRMSEIKTTLPPPHISVAELELFLFSLGALGVDVIEDLNGKEPQRGRRQAPPLQSTMIAKGEE